jgi:hypothetical protein
MRPRRRDDHPLYSRWESITSAGKASGDLRSERSSPFMVRPYPDKVRRVPPAVRTNADKVRGTPRQGATGLHPRCERSTLLQRRSLPTRCEQSPMRWSRAAACGIDSPAWRHRCWGGWGLQFGCGRWTHAATRRRTGASADPPSNGYCPPIMETVTVGLSSVCTLSGD